MKLITELVKFEPLLRSNLTHIIQRNLINTVDRSERKGEEPDYVAGLTLGLPADIFNLLRLLFPDFGFSISGMFCHQRPCADFGERPRPEIGDLLLVVIHNDSSGNQYGNSILFQVKRSDAPSINLEGDGSLHQLKLYTQWPDFTYYRAGALTGDPVRITPKSITPGAQYMVIDEDLPYSVDIDEGSHIRIAVPGKILYPRTDFAEQLCGLLSFKAGRPIVTPRDTTMDEWSKLIWNLIELAKKTTFNRKKSKLRNQGRLTQAGGLALHFSTPNTMSFMQDHFHSVKSLEDEMNVEQGEIGAVPTIIIESFETEGTERVNH